MIKYTKYTEKYLNLLELAISDYLHGPACRPLPEHGRRHVWWTPVMNCVCHFFKLFGVILSLPKKYNTWPDVADTMLPPGALKNIRNVLETCHLENIPGDFVECGCWRGGACVYAKAIVDALCDNRKVYGCDSFSGLPKPIFGDPHNDKHHTYSILSVPIEHAQSLPEKYGVGEIQWIKGWFKDSLPTLSKEIKNIAVLRCDADMYSSTMDILTNLYPLVSKNGFIIIDDWTIVPDSQRAVIDYLGYRPEVKSISEQGAVMFRKK
jgi:hypothetical protein